MSTGAPTFLAVLLALSAPASAAGWRPTRPGRPRADGVRPPLIRLGPFTIPRGIRPVPPAAGASADNVPPAAGAPAPLSAEDGSRPREGGESPARASLERSARGLAREDGQEALDALFSGSGRRPGPFLHTLQGRVGYRNSEFVYRDRKVGLFHAEDLSLRPWIPVSDRAAVGVDPRGRVFQVLDMSVTDESGRRIERNFAYLLNAGRPLTAVFLTEAGHLFGVDASGGLHQFSWKRWASSGWRRARTRALIWAGAAQAAAVALAAAWQASTFGGLWPIEPQTGALALLAGAGWALGLGLMALNRYGRINEHTDGFVHLGRRLPTARGYDRDGDDYRLDVPGRDPASLSAEIARGDWRPGWREDLDVRPEHRALERGVDPKSYEPDW